MLYTYYPLNRCLHVSPGHWIDMFMCSVDACMKSSWQFCFWIPCVSKKMNASVTNTASNTHKVVATSLVAIAFLLNAVCIMFTGRIAYHRPKWPNVLLVHVGIIDMCVLLLVLLPGTITLYLPETLNLLQFCQFQGTVLNAWYIIEFVLLAQIMFDRYFAISHPFVYSKRILNLSLIHIWRCRRSTLCRSRWAPYH